MTSFDFGYTWVWTHGHLVPLVAFSALVALAVWRKWSRWLAGAFAALALWAAAGFVITQHVLGANRPLDLPTASFLQAGTGRVLDLGAGSGRSTLDGAAGTAGSARDRRRHLPRVLRHRRQHAGAHHGQRSRGRRGRPARRQDGRHPGAAVCRFQLRRCRERICDRPPQSRGRDPSRWQRSHESCDPAASSC